jgi:hypothetical protein
MDVQAVLVELRAESKRLNEIIQTLERLTADETRTGYPKGLGRESMDLKSRREVSERMKRCWTQRRKDAATAASPIVHRRDEVGDPSTGK